jgi:soluble lytic murein transglycosylase-like protein
MTMKSKHVLSVMGLLMIFVGAWPQSTTAFCFERAARTYAIPSRLIEAIAYQESAFDPRAIHRNRNGSFDYGVMQINSWWFNTLGAERWQALADPCFNVRVGTWILRDCIDRHGYTWDGLACYRSGKPLDALALSVQRDVIGYIQRIKTYFDRNHHSNSLTR